MEKTESLRRARRRKRLEQLLEEFGGPAQVARESGTPKSHFSAMLAGKRGLGDELAAKLEGLYAKDPGWFDADDQPEGWGAWGQPGSPQDASANIPQLIVAPPNEAGRVTFEFSTNLPDDNRADWLLHKKARMASLGVMRAIGNAMEPRIYDGDALVVDTTHLDVEDDGVYALWYDGGLRIRRLYRRPGGGLRIKTDNPAHDTIDLMADEVRHVQILGRVVQVTSARRV